MKHAHLISILASIILAIPHAAAAAELPKAGTLIKGSSSAVYYVTREQTRYAFPNAKTFATWYKDFSRVQRIDDATLAALPLNGSITYRPGSRLVKLVSDPKVYAVDQGGVLRWIPTESVARSLFGEYWSSLVDDVPVAFFAHYRTGDVASDQNSYNAEMVRASVSSPNDDIALRPSNPPPVRENKSSNIELPSEPRNTEDRTATSDQNPESPPPLKNIMPPNFGCTSNPRPVFTHDITPTNAIFRITPPGSSSHGVGTITTHSYIWTEGARVPIYAPIDLTFVSGSFSSDRAGDRPDYGLDFTISCEASMKLGHILEPVTKIREQFSSTPKIGDSRRNISDFTPASFQAGELIGYTTGTVQAKNWDFGVYNTSRDPGLTGDHAVCPYDLYPEPKRSEYRSRYGGGMLRDPSAPTTYCK
jgi:hypothetical protein